MILYQFAMYIFSRRICNNNSVKLYNNIQACLEELLHFLLQINLAFYSSISYFSMHIANWHYLSVWVIVNIQLFLLFKACMCIANIVVSL